MNECTWGKKTKGLRRKGCAFPKSAALHSRRAALAFEEKRSPSLSRVALLGKAQPFCYVGLRF